MHSEVEAIPVDMEATQVAQLFEQHDWVSAPSLAMTEVAGKDHN